MELKGMFPNGLELYRNLEVLDLSNNDLSGPIPSYIDERQPSVSTLVPKFTSTNVPVEPKFADFGKAMLMNPNDIGLNMLRGFSINTEFWE
ncbi:hypothetical protein DITRI_Ditri15bG0010500 [Diplodiscus trichospermus]